MTALNRVSENRTTGTYEVVQHEEWWAAVVQELRIMAVSTFDDALLNHF